MALVIADRVLETTTTTGTGPVALAGASSGYISFGSGIGNNNTTYYTIASQSNSEWEVGLGTLDGTSANLTRTTVYASSNGGSAVNFSAGTKNVFCTYSATKGVYLDASNNVSALGTITSATWNGSTIGIAYGGTGSTSTTYCNLTSNVTGTLPIANGGTNASTASITSLNNITGYSFAGITGNTSTYNLVGSNTPTLTSPAITGGSIDNATVGATTASSGAFTSITATSKDNTGIFATNAGLTANTSVLNTSTYTTAGMTLANQTAAAGSVWRIRAYGQFTAINSGGGRTAQIACFWGSTQLTAITPSVLTSTAQTTQWQVEFELTGTSTTAIWTTGTLISRIASSTALAMDNATAASTAVTAGAQTLDLRVRVSTANAAEGWTIQQVTMERIE